MTTDTRLQGTFTGPSQIYRVRRMGKLAQAIGIVELIMLAPSRRLALPCPRVLPLEDAFIALQSTVFKHG